MAIRKFIVDVTTATATGTGYSPYLSGYVQSIQYIKDGSGAAYSDGVDATITSEATGEAIVTLTDMNASTIVKPRAATHTVAGAAATYDGTRPVLARIGLGRDRVKIAIAQGGNGKTGRFVIVVDDGRS